MENRSSERDCNQSRRTFLRNSGLGLLAGSAFAKGTGLAQTILKPNTDKYQSVTINTHEFYGDIEERLDFPKDWDIDVIKMAGHDTPVLTGDEIRKRVQSPIGTKRLSDIAAGKKTAVVTFDDLTRPTPAGAIAKYVLEELNAAGIDDDHILFYAAVGTHQLLSQTDVRAKLGDEIVNRCPWINHNVWDNFTDVGRTSFINRIEVGTYFHKADVKVTISGIKVHSVAGYGGGAKMILPGVTSFNTIFYNHGIVGGYERGIEDTTGKGNPTTGRGKILENDLRLDMIEAARLAGVDYSVQIVYNGKREPVAVYAGDIVDSHIEACRYANKHYVHDPVNTKDFDIIIRNAYPQARKADVGVQGGMREGGSSIIILQNPMCRSTFHFLTEHRLYRNASWWETFYRESASSGQGRSTGQHIIFSQYIAKKDLINVYRLPNVKVARTWDEVLGHLESAHRGGARVALFPYSQIQHPPLKLS